MNDLTEIIFIIDESGSMSGLEADTIGGFNSMIEKQKEEQAGKAVVTTVFFNTVIKTVHSRMALDKVPKLTKKDYTPGGCTALLDALGGTIGAVDRAHKEADPGDVPDHVLFVITTDGLENSSREFTQKKVKELITEKQEKGWEFIFVAANIDAAETAADYGINADNAVNYCPDELGTCTNYMAMSEAISNVRRVGKVGKAWKKTVSDDYNSRAR